MIIKGQKGRREWGQPLEPDENDYCSVCLEYVENGQEECMNPECQDSDYETCDCGDSYNVNDGCTNPKCEYSDYEMCECGEPYNIHDGCNDRFCGEG